MELLSKLMSNNNPRCCNLDWLEVFCLEPIERACDPSYFRECGYWVNERDYGTRVFSQMFTILDERGEPDIEVRRAPYSRLDDAGILPINAMHLRLSNRSCYKENAARRLLDFMQHHSIIFKNITRVDVCLDFLKFDEGDDPQAFIRRYVQRKYSKINQGNVRLYGRDAWTGQSWSSIAWGSPKSQVGTKLYNKSLELAQVHDKPYIRQAWFECGLIDNPYARPRVDANGDLDYPPVWRLEFSIKSPRYGWYTIEEDGHARNFHSYKNDIDTWATRDACFRIFQSLVPHYFRFKYYEADKRKDRCKDKPLFRFSDAPGEVYHIERIATATPRRAALDTLVRKLQEYRLTHTAQEQRQAVDIILSAILDEQILDDYGTPFSRMELLTLRQLISMKTKGDPRPLSELRLLIEQTDLNTIF